MSEKLTARKMTVIWVSPSDDNSFDLVREAMNEACAALKQHGLNVKIYSTTAGQPFEPTRKGG